MEFYIGQIILFGGNFAIRNFALANGQLLAISSNSALFSILGTTYGGDGRTTFGLPDLRGRVAVSEGRGPGLSDYSLGQRGGAETHTLTTAQMPTHNHQLPVHAAQGNEDEASPSGGVLANSGADNYTSEAPDAFYNKPTSSVGSSQSFGIRQPFLAINYEVCLLGIYPSRN